MRGQDGGGVGLVFGVGGVRPELGHVGSGGVGEVGEVSRVRGRLWLQGLFGRRTRSGMLSISSASGVLVKYMQRGRLGREDRRNRIRGNETKAFALRTFVQSALRSRFY